MNSYSDLSKIYDQWQEANDAFKWADYVEKLLAKHCKIVKGDGKDDSFLLLDLGCGTGGFAIEMSRRGYDVLGIDQSADMLSIAKDKEGAGKVQFIQQDITKMELFGTVDVIVCFLDTINHILDEKKLNKLFKLCKNYLNPDGLFIFDIATPYYFANVLGNHVFYDIKEQYSLIWQNFVDIRKNRSQSELTFFLQQDDGSYLRGEELIEEKIYAVDNIESLIQNNNLTLLKQYGELSFKKPSETSKRIFFVCENSQDEWKKELNMISFENRGKKIQNNPDRKK